MTTATAKPHPPDTFCSRCGTRYEDTTHYPRTCRNCGAQVWANPTPVAVALVPIVVGERTGLLVVRRAIPPQIGKLALVGGFVEAHESWQVGCARELREESNVIVDAAKIEPIWVASSEPVPNRVLIFGQTPPIAARDLPALVANSEVQERGVIFGVGGDPGESLAFPLHEQAAARFFRSKGRHDYVTI